MKSEIIKNCEQDLKNKKLNISQDIEKIIDSMGSDTKSSAGDKFETGREMMNQEKEKLRVQLAIFDKQLGTLHQIKLNDKYETVKFGAMVRTTFAHYFISISYGKVSIKQNDVFLISAVTPLAQLMIGKKVGDKLNWNGKEILIEEIH